MCQLSLVMANASTLWPFHRHDVHRLQELPQCFLRSHVRQREFFLQPPLSRVDSVSRQFRVFVFCHVWSFLGLPLHVLLANSAKFFDWHVLDRASQSVPRGPDRPYTPRYTNQFPFPSRSSGERSGTSIIGARVSGWNNMNYGFEGHVALLRGKNSITELTDCLCHVLPPTFVPYTILVYRRPSPVPDHIISGLLYFSGQPDIAGAHRKFASARLAPRWRRVKRTGGLSNLPRL